MKIHYPFFYNINYIASDNNKKYTVIIQDTIEIEIQEINKEDINLICLFKLNDKKYSLINHQNVFYINKIKNFIYNTIDNDISNINLNYINLYDFFNKTHNTIFDPNNFSLKIDPLSKTYNINDLKIKKITKNNKEEMINKIKNYFNNIKIINNNFYISTDEPYFVITNLQIQDKNLYLFNFITHKYKNFLKTEENICLLSDFEEEFEIYKKTYKDSEICSEIKDFMLVNDKFLTKSNLEKNNTENIYRLLKYISDSISNNDNLISIDKDIINSFLILREKYNNLKTEYKDSTLLEIIDFINEYKLLLNFSNNNLIQNKIDFILNKFKNNISIENSFPQIKF